MPTDFVLPNDPALERAIASCTSAEEIRELTHRYLQEHGVIQRERGGESIVEQAGGRMPQRVASMPASSGLQTVSRFIYPHLNDRIEIFGGSEQELDEKEKAIRASYGRR